MVTLQILVLPFLVRVRVPQLTERGFHEETSFLLSEIKINSNLFCNSPKLHYLCI